MFVAFDVLSFSISKNSNKDYLSPKIGLVAGSVGPTGGLA